MEPGEKLADTRASHEKTEGDKKDTPCYKANTRLARHTE